jgi:ferredoxin
MKLEIDWTRCAGHGLCATLLPERISRDEWGFPAIRTSDVPAGEARRVRQVVAVCPELALRLENR